MVVLVTGAKGGLGTFVTQSFLDSGARVIGVSRSIEDSDFDHPSFSALPAELSSADAAEVVVKTAVGRWGRIDALVHLLGGFAGGMTVSETDQATCERMFQMNFYPAFHMIRAVVPQMRRQRAGSILAIGARAAVEPQAGLSAYSASKAALLSLIRTVALENQDCGITANAVLPGTMDTPANRAAMPGADFSSWVPPGQVAGLLTHLSSSLASRVSAALIPVYGREL